MFGIFRATKVLTLAASTALVGISTQSCVAPPATGCSTIMSSLDRTSNSKLQFTFQTLCGHLDEYAAIERLESGTWKAVRQTYLPASESSVQVSFNFCTAFSYGTFRAHVTLGGQDWYSTNTVAISAEQWTGSCPL